MEVNIINITLCKCSDMSESTDIIEKSINSYYKTSMLHIVHRLRYIRYTEHLRI
jgi:hypothetical protein